MERRDSVSNSIDIPMVEESTTKKSNAAPPSNESRTSNNEKKSRQVAATTEKLSDVESGEDFSEYIEESDNATTPTDCEDAKTSSTTDYRSKTNGMFFAYMVIGAMIFCPISLSGHVAAFFYGGRNWQLGNYAEKLLGYEEMTKEGDEPTILEFHAFFGMLVLLVLAFQPISVVMFSKNKNDDASKKQSSWLRVAHKYLGRALVVMIVISAASGAWYVSVSRDWGDKLSRAYHNLSFAIGFAIISINMGIGIYAVSVKKEKDYLLHKAAMACSCFQIFWTSLPQVLATSIQLGFQNACGLGDQGYFSALSLGYSIQLIVLVAAMKRYDPHLFRMRIVRYNLMAFTAFTLYVILAVLSLVLFPPQDDTCFGVHSPLRS